MPEKRSNPTYYAGDLKADLVNEALTVIEDQGAATISLRALAKRLGVSHAAPAHHFASKSDLFAEIARQGFEGLAAALTSAEQRAVGDVEPVEMIERLGLAYLTFAGEHPAHFALMFRTDLVNSEHVNKEGAAAFNILRDAVSRTQEYGWRPTDDSHTLATLLWAIVHGYAHLEAEGSPLVADGQQRKAVLHLALHQDACSSHGPPP